MTLSESQKIVGFFSVTVLYIAVLSAIYLNFPALKPDEAKHFKYPRSLDDAKLLGKILLKYKNEHFATVLSAVCMVYVFLQSFAIPGSIFLTILSGYLFPFYISLGLVCMCSASGAVVCYFISHSFLRKLLLIYIPEKIESWQKEVEKHRNDMYHYIFFLRVTPILPNWFINVASPIVNVPIKPFFVGTFLGVMPPSFFFINAGTALQSLNSTSEVWSVKLIATLVLSGVLSIAPVLYKKFLYKSSV